jgi:hypothetical protein
LSDIIVGKRSVEALRPPGLTYYTVR